MKIQTLSSGITITLGAEITMEIAEIQLQAEARLLGLKESHTLQVALAKAKRDREMGRVN